MRIAVLSRVAPVSKTVLGAIRYIVTEKTTADVAEKTDREIADALSGLGNIEAAAHVYALQTGQGRVRAAALLMANSLRGAA